MRKLQICARIIYCAVMAFWTSSVVECAVFATPSWMHTVSRNLEGRSLTAKSAEEFKKKQLAAAAAEGKVVPLAATGGAVTGCLAVLLAGLAYVQLKGFCDYKKFLIRNSILTTEQEIKAYTLKSEAGLYPIFSMAVFFALWSAAGALAFFANIPGAKKRKSMHMLHAQYADLLYSLLQNSKFKKRMGVKSWEDVRRRRKQAEIVGIITQIAGSVFGAFALKSLSNFLEDKQIVVSFNRKKLGDGTDVRWIKEYTSVKHKKSVPTDASLAMGYAAVAWPILIGIAAKARITRVMRRKGGAPQLNKEFARAIAAAKAQEDLAQSVVSR